MLSNLAVQVYKYFEEMTDPRLNRGLNHDLGEIVFIALTAALAGADSWADVERFGVSHQDWFAKHLPLENGIPSHDTFSRVLARLDSGEFLTALHRWIDDFSDSLRGQGIAIDGKTLRGSHDARHGQSPLHTITAFACGTRTVLRQMSVPDKSNEIPAVPLLLQMLDLVDATVMLDALHCQPETLKAVLDRGGDYIVTVKRNQHSLNILQRDTAVRDNLRGKRLRAGWDRSRPVHVCFANQFCDNNVFGFELLSVGASRTVRSHSG